MLFNSYVFMFLFLPVVLAGFYGLGGRSFSYVSIHWLVIASLVFYCWWNPPYVFLLMMSVCINYLIGSFVQKDGKSRRTLLCIGLGFNLSLLGYYKYSNFFIYSVFGVSETSRTMATIILPLGISFFTFQQIAYLIDKYKGLVEEKGFLQYALFVSFFPQLIAGPIVHYKEILQQFRSDNSGSVLRNIALGLTLFILGLSKKVILADSIAAYSTPVFDAASVGVQLTIWEAWGGALAYTFQLYFDFSGYSDMALGLGRMFGIALPINFFSPYKARSIIEFWSHWHITLSRFLRDYLYIPLGGNQKGRGRRLANLMITMLLGGFWHGAGWTFLLWGGLHGVYLMINHGWRMTLGSKQVSANINWLVCRLSWLVTFVSIVLAWVMFRSESVSSALSMYGSMLGANGIAIPARFINFVGQLPVLDILGVEAIGLFSNQLVDWRSGLLLFLFFGIITFKFPNSCEIFRLDYKKTESLDENSGTRVIWTPSTRWAVGSLLALVVCVEMMREAISEFLYFQF